MAGVRVKIDERPMRRLVLEIRGATGKAAPGPNMRAIQDKWVRRLVTFTQRRFVRLSAGGGEWPPLAPATIARRRGGGRGVKILRDTGQMYRSLGVGGSGFYARPIPGGIRYGVQGGSRTTRGGRLTAGGLVAVHHYGLGRVPVRRIVVAPDAATRAQMAEDLAAGLRRAQKGAA